MLSSVILAAGKGTRMKSSLPKVMHLLNNKPMLHYVLEAALKVSSEVVCVIGYKPELVKEYLDNFTVKIAYQKEQKGTGHALICALKEVSKDVKYILVLSGDVPLIKSKTLENLKNFHLAQKNKISFLVTKVSNPTGYGRVLRDDANNVLKIIEESEATDKQKLVSEVNGGIYIFEKSFLQEFLPRLKNNNKKGEYYLTDLIEIAALEDLRIGTCMADEKELFGIDTLEKLAKAEELMEKKVIIL